MCIRDRGEPALPEPDALFQPTHQPARQKDGKYRCRDEQCPREGRQNAAGGQHQQQAQPERDAGRRKENGAAVGEVVPGVGRHPELGQQLPEQLFLPGAVDEKRQFRRCV